MLASMSEVDVSKHSLCVSECLGAMHTVCLVHAKIRSSQVWHRSKCAEHCHLCTAMQEALKLHAQALTKRTHLHKTKRHSSL